MLVDFWDVRSNSTNLVNELHPQEDKLHDLIISKYVHLHQTFPAIAPSTASSNISILIVSTWNTSWDES